MIYNLNPELMTGESDHHFCFFVFLNQVDNKGTELFNNNRNQTNVRFTRSCNNCIKHYGYWRELSHTLRGFIYRDDC